MKSYLQKAVQNYSENFVLYLQVSTVLGIILGISLFVGMISGLFVFLLFLLLPLFVSVAAIAMKTSTTKDCTNKDIYFGYRNFGSSLVLTTKVFMKPILMGFLTYFVIAMIGCGIILYDLYVGGNSIVQGIFNGSIQNSTEALQQLVSDDRRFLYVTYASMVGSLIVAYNIYLRRSLTPFICFETTFTLDSAKKMSINMTKKQNKFILFNNLFLILYIVLFVVQELFQMIIFENETNFYLLYFIDVLVTFLLMAPLLFINALFIFNYYDDKHRDHAKNLYKDYLNVAMRAKQNDVIDNDNNEQNNQ